MINHLHIILDILQLRIQVSFAPGPPGAYGAPEIENWNTFFIFDVLHIIQILTTELAIKTLY